MKTANAGLGRKLFSEIQAILQQICETPEVWEKIDAQTHRCLTNRFPYAVLYRVIKVTIFESLPSCTCGENPTIGKADR